LKIKAVEIRYIKLNKDSFTFKGLRKYSENKLYSYLRLFKIRYLSRQIDTVLVDSQMWTLERTSSKKSSFFRSTENQDLYTCKRNIEYLVLIYHDKQNEQFYTKVIPKSSFLDKLYMMYINRKLE
jgi:hypothetical protein